MKKTDAIDRLVASLRKTTWKSVWAGDWTMLPCSDWGEFYTKDVRIAGKQFVQRVVFVFHHGKVSCWLAEKEIDRVSHRLARYVGVDVRKITRISNGLRRNTDAALRFMRRTNPARLNISGYYAYLRAIRDYYQWHIQVKYVIDGLSEPLVKRFMPVLQAARVYAEPVFDATLAFERKAVEAIAKKTRIHASLLLFLTRDEFAHYLKTGKVPLRMELEKRRTLGALVFEHGAMKIFTGRQARLVESALTALPADGALKGMSAFRGKVRGIVRIIFDPRKVARFDLGDILVAPMTRPDYLPLMKRAAAIVTDTGGMLAHAAIVAREMKKPCVIGTKIATKVFKDGDLVEVDAEKGIVRKI